MSSSNLTVESYLADPISSNELLIKTWDEIPMLDDVKNHDIVDGSLFRFRGMIQDMPNPVYFYEKYSVQNTTTGQISTRSGKYRDSLVCKDDEKLLLDSELSVSSERRPYYCVNIPALNSWARPKAKTKIISPHSTQKIDDISNSFKRSADDMEVENELNEITTNTSNKRQCINEPCSSTAEHRDSVQLVPSCSACIIHVYDVGQDDSIKVNDLVDVVGFVYVSGADQDDINVPPSLAPRLHVVALKMSPELNPLVTNTTNILEFVSKASAIRAELHFALTQLFFGDHLAADFTICHLLANVYSRINLNILGKFSLNIFNMPTDSDYTQGVFDILSLLVPKSVFFPMSLQNMNTANLVPVKDYESNRLTPGILQLSNRTHFVVDETKMQAGKLLERGMKNLQALNTLLTDQSVNYDFKFYSLPFPANIPVLVLSEGKSLLQVDTNLKLVPDLSFVGSTIKETLEGVRSYLKEPLLSNIRTYLTVLSSRECALPDDMSKSVQDHFVAMMQESPKTSPDELHSHLMFARLLSLSNGVTSLSKDFWERASQLDRLRRSRL